jgi:dTDP-4-amino-4,6-dideoxygalactose transaminase
MAQANTALSPVPAASAARMPGHRHLALLGGTTTVADCLVAIRYLVDPRQLTQGPALKAYERAFARQIGVRFAYSFSAGRIGLYGVLRALGVGPGDEVLLQVPTHIVVANAIRFTGARPVYVDCRLDSYNIDLEDAARKMTSRTKVLLLQHTFGIPVDLDAALALAREHKLDVIEDCVHSLGATFHGKPVGSFGRAAFFSTEETKTISTTMGGMLVTDDPDLATRMAAFQATCAWPPAALTVRYLLKLVMYHFLLHPAIHGSMRALYERLGDRHPLPRPLGQEEYRGLLPARYEQRLSNAQAALALRQLRRLESNLSHRREIAAAIDGWLRARGYETPQAPAAAAPVLLRYPVWVEDRAAAVAATRRYLVLGTWFRSVLEDSASPTYADYLAGSCPRAEAAAEHLVNLPTHPRVSAHDAEVILSRVAAGRIQPRVRA